MYSSLLVNVSSTNGVPIYLYYYTLRIVPNNKINKMPLY